MKTIEINERKVISQEREVHYRIYLPDGYEDDADQSWPLVVFLHGAGQRGADSAVLELHGPPKEAAAGRSFPFILLAPQCSEDTVWIMQKELVMSLIGDIRQQYSVDAQRIYLTGLSMGGFGTWEIAMEHPDVFAAIMPVCGGGMSWRLNNLLDKPIWTFHGAKDTVVPILYTDEMVRALKALGNPAKYTVYPDAEHDCWTEVYRREDVYAWLLSHVNPNK
ncbi:prolyl oligopeptidase family serine peptidase [Paenibacillus oryzisoli]|uniref:carboxylesterase family protein n=1 Tax=Paenibacillus oryzisoli TaxID=1850517 RepID=UPI003D2854AE